MVGHTAKIESALPKLTLPLIGEIDDDRLPLEDGFDILEASSEDEG